MDIPQTLINTTPMCGSTARNVTSPNAPAAAQAAGPSSFFSPPARDAFEYIEDFETYRAAHADTVSSDVIMDPEGEL